MEGNFFVDLNIYRALDSLEVILLTWKLKLSCGSKKTPKNLTAGILLSETTR